jgi:hypothetical protein
MLTSRLEGKVSHLAKLTKLHEALALIFVDRYFTSFSCIISKKTIKRPLR